MPSTFSPHSSNASRPASTVGLNRQLLSRAAIAAALFISLPACSHAPRWADPGTAPLPSAWVPPAMPHSQRAPVQPPWGVPAFEPPSATHCQGPQRLREQPGRAPQAQVMGHAAAPLALARSREGLPRDASTGDAVASATPPMSADHAGARAPVPAPAPAATTTPAPAARSEARRGDGAAAKSAEAALSASPPALMHGQLQPQPFVGQAERRPAEIVTAGMVDDNAAFADYLAYRARSAHLNPRDRDASERYRIELRDSAGRPVADAEVALSWPGARAALRFARSDSAGQVWLHPRMLLAPHELAALQALEVQARAPSGEVVRAPLQRGQKPAVQLRLTRTDAAPARTPLDLVFLVDATGSMGDEIHKLRSSLRSIAERVRALPSQPDMCWGMVAYRDRGDAFLTRTHDLTNDLGAFQQSLTRLQAAGGGDYPEALNEALNEAVHHISWRSAGTARLVVLVADAPPHFDRGGPYHDEGAAAALARGIKLHTVGASGLDAQGEAVFRQLAQTTGGRFIFLTYRDAHRPSSGPGRETTHDVRDYSVDTLDELIVRLVREELAGKGPV